MLNPIKEICSFNAKAGLLEAEYSDALESSFLIEEALEGFSGLDKLATKLGITHESDITPKQVSRDIISLVYSPEKPLTEVERLDKACDAVVFAIGSMAKLGLRYHEITKALNIVMKHNNAKLHMPKDAFGKLLKPEGFTGPETELQQLLDTLALSK